MVSQRISCLFPLLCGIGGALLLTHSHSLGNVKDELLAELSHVPLALMGVLAGWSRWLELRLPAKERRIPSFIWPVCFVLIGAVLLGYREG
jgi:putative copper resistance protein D